MNFENNLYVNGEINNKNKIKYSNTSVDIKETNIQFNNLIGKDVESTYTLISNNDISSDSLSYKNIKSNYLNESFIEANYTEEILNFDLNNIKDINEVSVYNAKIEAINNYKNKLENYIQLSLNDSNIINESAYCNKTKNKYKFISNFYILLSNKLSNDLIENIEKNTILNKNYNKINKETIEINKKIEELELLTNSNIDSELLLTTIEEKKQYIDLLSKNNKEEDNIKIHITINEQTKSYIKDLLFKVNTNCELLNKNNIKLKTLKMQKEKNMLKQNAVKDATYITRLKDKISKLINLNKDLIYANKHKEDELLAKNNLVDNLYKEVSILNKNIDDLRNKIRLKTCLCLNEKINEDKITINHGLVHNIYNNRNYDLKSNNCNINFNNSCYNTPINLFVDLINVNNKNENDINAKNINNYNNSNNIRNSKRSKSYNNNTLSNNLNLKLNDNINSNIHNKTFSYNKNIFSNIMKVDNKDINNIPTNILIKRRESKKLLIDLYSEIHNIININTSNKLNINNRHTNKDNEKKITSKNKLLKNKENLHYKNNITNSSNLNNSYLKNKKHQILNNSKKIYNTNKNITFNKHKKSISKNKNKYLIKNSNNTNKSKIDLNIYSKKISNNNLFVKNKFCNIKEQDNNFSLSEVSKYDEDVDFDIGMSYINDVSQILDSETKNKVTIKKLDSNNFDSSYFEKKLNKIISDSDNFKIDLKKSFNFIDKECSLFINNKLKKTKSCNLNIKRIKLLNKRNVSF